MAERRQQRAWTGWAVAATLLSLSACHEGPLVELEHAEPQMVVGESRQVELRFLRLDVDGFRQRLTLADLRAMPQKTLDELWLLDMDLGPLMHNGLEQLRQMSPDEAAELPLAAQNMRNLINMTPDNAVLDGTSFDELIDLSAAVGIPPARALANLFGIGVTDYFHPLDIVSDVSLDQVIGSHPNAQLRGGPIDEDHPDGLYPVAPHAIPITLGDVATNFEDLERRFGPSGDHPGFIEEATGVSVIEEDFAMSVKIRANALPYKGVDLTNAGEASINSLPGQIETLFAFEDPDWLQIEGMIEVPVIEQLTLTIVEADAFIPAGDSRDPTPTGNSPAWELEDWRYERLVAEMSARIAENIPAHCDNYELGTGVTAFEACIDETGWVDLQTFNNVGNPPPPGYMWDVDLEIAQVRLHDGGLAEGDADIQMTLENVPTGLPPEQLVEQIAENMAQNPAAMTGLAREISGATTTGDADIYYYRADDGTDYLYFVAPEDLRRDDDGDFVRGYDYASPGFFADQSLTNKRSSTDEVDGDTVHEKVAITPGETLYIEDDEGRVFRVSVSEKPSVAHVLLDVTRVE